MWITTFVLGVVLSYHMTAFLSVIDGEGIYVSLNESRL